jgi:3-dehydroquinate synthase class II
MRKQWVVVGILAGALSAGDALAQHKQPNEQPTTAAAPDKVPTGEVALGIARISRAVTADGKPLPAGSYTVRVTAQTATPDAVGTTETLERWVEFLQRGEVKGREVVSIVPDAESTMVVQDAPPRPGTSKVQILRGNDYLRVWFNKDGHHYLIHLPTGSM